MELVVDIAELELTGAQKVNVVCTADNGSEVREPTSAATTANSQSRRKWPKFSFRFAGPVPQVILSFSARDSSSGAKVGKCAVLVPLVTTTGAAEQLHSGSADSQGRCCTAILSSPIAGTDTVKFAGKIHFSTQHTYSVPPPSSELSLPWPIASTDNLYVARHQQPPSSLVHIERSIDGLAAREAATLGDGAAVPDGDATVTLILHALNVEGALDTKPTCIAFPRGGSVVLETRKVAYGNVGAMQSILVQKKLRCGPDVEAIEIHIVKTDRVIHSMSLPLTSLQPFVYKHWCQPFTATSPASFATLVDGQNPGMVATAVLTLPKASYSQWEGLEVCICWVEPGFSTDYSKMVVCAQVINEDSKSRLREPNFHNPPFDEGGQTKQKVRQGNRQDVYVYKMAVMSIVPRCEEVYFFFPADQEVRTTGGHFAIQLSLYPVRSATKAPWWGEPQVGGAYLEVTPILGFLQQAVCQNGVRWEAAIEEPLTSPSSPSERSPSAASEGTIGAVLRWKSRSMPFISLQTVREFHTLPDLNHHVSSGSPDVRVVAVEVTHTRDLHETDLLLLAQHKKAISQMGQDILQLRQQNASLVAENQQLRSQARSVQGYESIEYAKLEALGKHELVQTVLLLQNDLLAETAARKESQNRAQGLQSLLTRQSYYEAQYTQLLEVHAVQQRLVQQLQAKVQKYQRCYEICKQQQTIVNQLEALLAHQIATQDMSVTPVTARLQRDNAELRATLQRYQDEDDTVQRLTALQEREQNRVEDELSQALARCRQLEALLERREPTAPQGLNLELQQRLLLAETQVNSLLTELKESARKWAIEKSYYEMQLADHRNRLTSEPTCANPNGGKIISF